MAGVGVIQQSNAISFRNVLANFHLDGPDLVIVIQAAELLEALVTNFNLLMALKSYEQNN